MSIINIPRLYRNIGPRGETKVTKSEINKNQNKQVAKTNTKDKNKQ